MTIEIPETFPSRAWVVVGPLEVFVRRACRNLNGVRGETIDIVNIRYTNQEQRGKGLFKAFLEDIESRHTTVYVECVIPERFRRFFIKRGYTELPSELYPSYFKEFP